MKRIVWLKRVSFAFLAIAVGIIGIIGWNFWSFPGDAISFAIPMQKDFSITRQFRLPATAEYRIEIRFSRLIEFERLKKLLQDGNVAQVTLIQNGHPVTMRYFSEPRFQPGIVSTDENGNLGDFTGDPGSIYTITCLIVRPVKELTVTNPTLLVTLDPMEVEGGAVLNALLFGAALLSAILAIAAGSVYVYLRRRSTMSLRISDRV
jgi:hypothetical protein